MLSTREISLWWVAQYILLRLIHWIEIYMLDSNLQRLHWIALSLHWITKAQPRPEVFNWGMKTEIEVIITAKLNKGENDRKCKFMKSHIKTQANLLGWRGQWLKVMIGFSFASDWLKGWHRVFLTNQWANWREPELKNFRFILDKSSKVCSTSHVWHCSSVGIRAHLVFTRLKLKAWMFFALSVILLLVI